MSNNLAMDYKSAHSYSSHHRKQIFESELCGCFHCLKIFTPNIIDEWIDENDDDVGQTAMCPYCDIDSVVGSASGVPITKEFLGGMNQVWFTC